MTLTIPDDVRAKAEIYVGDAAGQEKTKLLLEETGLPSGLLPLRDIIECGYVEETGFVWLKQRRKVDRYFAKAGRHVSYGAEVSAVAEKGRLKKITGVKAKEMLIWVTLNEICLDDNPTSGKLVCKALGGLSRSFPVEAFEAEGGGPKPAAAVKPAAGAGDNGNGKLAGAAGAANGFNEPNNKPAAAVVENGDAGKKEEQVKKPEEEKESAAADKAGDKKEAAGKTKDAAVDGVEEKLKELSTKDAAVHAEAVATKN